MQLSTIALIVTFALGMLIASVASQAGQAAKVKRVCLLQPDSSPLPLIVEEVLANGYARVILSHGISADWNLRLTAYDRPPIMQGGQTCPANLSPS
jgi:hypothetical protein